MQWTTSLYVIVFWLLAPIFFVRQFERCSRGVIAGYVILTAVFLALVSGLRELYIGSDTSTYVRHFLWVQSETYGGSWEDAFVNRFETGYALYVYLLTQISDSPRVFLIITAAVQVILYAVFALKATRGHYPIFLSFMLISLFATYNLTTNTLRQGIAVGICLIAMSRHYNHRYLVTTALILLAAQFHSTALLLLGILLKPLMRLKVLTLLPLWCLVALFAATGLNESLLKPLLNAVGLEAQFAHLFTSSAYERYDAGFRLDFILFSAIPLFLFMLLDIWQPRRLPRKRFYRVLKMYLLSNIPFILLMFIPYSDRLALYSWMLMPWLVTEWILAMPERRRRVFTQIGLIATFVLGLLGFNFHTLMQLELILD